MRQLPTLRGLSPPVHSPSPSGYTYAYGRIRNPQQTYVKRAASKVHFNLNPAFKVIQGYPYLCRQEPRAVYCRNVQLMPPLLARDSIYAIARYMPSPVRLSVWPSVWPSVTRVDQSKTVEVRITQPSPQSSPMTSFLTPNGTLKFEREDRERGRQIREGYEKTPFSATAGIVFRFTRRRCYRALTLALAGLSCLQRVRLSIACYAERCTSYSKSVRPD